MRITHSEADGTLVDGDPRPHQQVLKDLRFRYSRRIGWYLPNSRYKPARRDIIDRAAEGLRSVGFDVEVDVDDEMIAPAEREQLMAERHEQRVDGLETRAERLGGQAVALHDRARDMASIIPMGQPILVGHYSEGRDRNYRNKIDRTYTKAFETLKEAQAAEHAAAAAVANARHREAPGTILRRIERDEAEIRRIQRMLTPCELSGRKMKPEAAGRMFTCPRCYKEVTVGEDLLVPEHDCAVGEHKERITEMMVRLQAEVDYWRNELAAQEAAGVKLWGPDDFTKGDRVNGNCEVIRVNKKSLTVMYDAFAYAKHTSTLPYNKVHKKG